MIFVVLVSPRQLLLFWGLIFCFMAQTDGILIGEVNAALSEDWKKIGGLIGAPAGAGAASAAGVNMERDYEKKLTLAVHIEGEDRVTMMQLLRAVRAECGVVIGCRYRTPTEYELTMLNEDGKNRLIDGLKIKNSRVWARTLSSDEMNPQSYQRGRQI